MRKSKQPRYILRCCETGCKARLTIKAETMPPGFLPVREFEEEAKKKGWQASMIRRKYVFCPNHHQK